MRIFRWRKSRKDHPAQGVPVPDPNAAHHHRWSPDHIELEQLGIGQFKIIMALPWFCVICGTTRNENYLEPGEELTADINTSRFTE